MLDGIYKEQNFFLKKQHQVFFTNIFLISREFPENSVSHMVESNKQKIRSVLTLLTFQNEKDEMFFKLDRCTFFKRGISFIENLLGYYKHIFVYLIHSNNNS